MSYESIEKEVQRMLPETTHGSKLNVALRALGISCCIKREAVETLQKRLKKALKLYKGGIR